MAGIYIIDTSVLLNILDVPGRNQDRDTVIAAFEARIRAGSRFQVPIAVIVETGNHIARISSGDSRKRYAEEFCAMVEQALAGKAPWVVTPIPDVGKIRKWLTDFPDQYAVRGLGIADRSIIHAWEEACIRNPSIRVVIWSRDKQLASYDRKP